jgi:urease subunit alpha
LAEQLGLHRRAVAVKNTRNITKRDRVLNDYLPVMEVDSQTYEGRADGMLLICEPARVLPLAQRHFFVLTGLASEKTAGYIPGSGGWL